MYTRENSDCRDTIPDNYNGTAMKIRRDEGCEKTDTRERECAPKHVCADECELSPPSCHAQKSSGIFSSLLGKLGLDGIDTTELVILFAALLLLGDGCDDDNYIWVILLLLLLIK